MGCVKSEVEPKEQSIEVRLFKEMQSQLLAARQEATNQDLFNGIMKDLINYIRDKVKGSIIDKILKQINGYEANFQGIRGRDANIIESTARYTMYINEMVGNMFRYQGQLKFEQQKISQKIKQFKSRPPKARSSMHIQNSSFLKPQKSDKKMNKDKKINVQESSISEAQTNRTYSLPRQVLEIDLYEQNVGLKQMKNITQGNVIQLNQKILKLQKVIENLKVQLKQQLKQAQGRRQKDTFVFSGVIQSLKKDNAALQLQIKDHVLQNTQLQSKIKQLQRTIQQSKLNQVLLRRISQESLELKLKSAQKIQNNAIKQSNQFLSSNAGKNSSSFDYQILIKYFSSSCLLPSFHELDFAVKLRTQIASMLDKKLKYTKLMYAYDPLSQLHFQPYIAGQYDIMVLIGLKNGIVIGGFAGEFDSNQSITNSFLFSISSQKEPIKLITKQKIKKIDYFSGFINFGNGELKLKARTLKFSCNVSGFQSIYFVGDRRITIDRFLGGQERQPDIVGYEIHKIYFEQSYQ